MPDVFYMRRALALAARGQGRTSPNPLVGAVVVQAGEIVGEGWHQRAGTPHAEVHALAQAGALARGATVYVTLEPCAHFGRTPPCTAALLEAGVQRVVAAMVDPNPRVSGQGLATLKAAGVETTVGVLEEEARRLNEAYVKYITTGRPFVLLKGALTLDGKIATSAGDSRWISGPDSRRLVHQLRDEYDAVLVGVNTVLRDDPRLTTRLADWGRTDPHRPPRDPRRVIVDSQARTPPTAQVLRGGSAAPTLIATLASAPAERRAALEAAGAEVLLLPARDGRVDLSALMEELGRREITSVLLEGGGTLNAGALAAGIVDKVLFFIAPKIAGGRDAPTPVEGPGVARMAEAWRVEKLQTRMVGGDVVVEGYVREGHHGLHDTGHRAQSTGHRAR